MTAMKVGPPVAIMRAEVIRAYNRENIPSSSQMNSTAGIEAASPTSSTPRKYQ